MKAFSVFALVLGILVGTTLARVDDPPKEPTPLKEHTWLAQLSGEWVTDGECTMAPGQPPMKCKGTETVRSLGGFWSVTEMKAEFMGNPMTGLMTIGYDPAKKKYVGTWVCSGDATMFKYEGTVEGNTLTLNTEGPHPGSGKIVKMRDAIEVKGADHKVLKSTIMGDDGKWTTFMTMNCRRKK